MKRALILGIGGQDGSFLAEILLEKGYEVHGLYRRSSADNLFRINHIRNKIILHQGDITDTHSIYRVLTHTGFDEIYNEADQDHVGWSVNTIAYSMQVTAGAVGALLQAIVDVSALPIHHFQQ